jgi:hypothetical protein
LALRIALRWGKDPTWFYTLDSNTRVDLIAEYRLSTETAEQSKKRADRIKAERFQKLIDRSQHE